MGSSALENLLASSPHVTTMCAKTGWQCESTWSLCEHPKILDCARRWEENSTDWYQAYDFFESTEIWDDMSKLIRIDKSPPNIVKYKQLIEYFERTNKLFVFIAMKPGHCRIFTRTIQTPAKIDMQRERMEELEANVDPRHIIWVTYTDMVTRTDTFVTRLLHALPMLGQIGINSRHIHGSDPNRKRRLTEHQEDWREASLFEYITSNQCKLNDHCALSSMPLPN